MNFRCRVGGVALAAVWSEVGRACTVCLAGADGSGENGTREALFGAGFFPTLVLTLLPFGVLAGLVVALRFVFPEEKPANLSGINGPTAPVPECSAGGSRDVGA